MSLWPFRTGDNDRFQVTASDETIYDALKNDLPPHAYSVEMVNYLEWRWRRGYLQCILPVTFYSAVIGFCVGFRQSRVEGRYVGRYHIMWRYTSTFAAVGLLTAGIHQFLIVKNRYRDKFYYPIIAGATGSTVLTVAAQMGTVAQGIFAGSCVGVLYALGCYAMDYYYKRHMTIFLQQQQLQQVPVHKVSPELQRLYRAYLFDNRPLEEFDFERREATVRARGAGDTRLDAYAFMHNMTPEVYDWVAFPDWWPLKVPAQTEEEKMLFERQRAEEIERRTRAYLETEDGAMIKHKIRAKQYRDA